MNNSWEPTKQDRKEHKEFFDWYAANFPSTYIMGVGRILKGGNFGFSFPVEGTTHLVYKPRTGYSPTLTGWQTMDYLKSIKAARKEGKITELTYSQAYNIRFMLGQMLIYWRHNLSRLMEHTGTADDLRQRATLTVILQYQIPQTP